MNTSTLWIILLILIGSTIVFLVIREIVCWYSKINERIELQKQTNRMLENIFKQLGGDTEEPDQKNDINKA